MLENEKHYKDNIAGDLSRGSTRSNKVNNACANVSVFTVAVNQAKRSTRSSAQGAQSVAQTQTGNVRLGLSHAVGLGLWSDSCVSGTDTDWQCQSS